MVDYLEKSIIQIAVLQLGKLPLEGEEQNVEGLEILDHFLQNENELALCGILENRGKLRFSKALPDFECEKTVLFSKRSPLKSANEDFLKRLQINTVSGKPTVDLYEFLSNIFTPQLQKDFSVLSYVKSVEDERRYWECLAASKADKLTRKSAENFGNLLHSIAGDLSIIESLPVSEVEDILERAHNTLDDLWRCNPGLPRDRMKNLMDIIGLDVCKHATKQFTGCNIWKDDYNVVVEKCLQSVALGEKWLTTCKQLTGLFWPSFSSNPWKEAAYQPSELEQFISRIQEVVNIRTAHKQLLRLSTPEEQSDLDADKVFKPFLDVNIFSCDDVTKDLLKARKEFEYLLQPAEERVASKLKKQLMSLIYEFTRYSELINRKVFKNNLLAERQFLLNSLSEYVAKIQSQSNLETSKIVTRQETSDTIKEILFIRQLEGKANEVVFVLDKLLNDLEGFQSIKDFIQGVVNDLKSQHGELFNGWSSDVITAINSNKLSLKETDPVIEFSKDKLMKVNYPSRLITLISEVRQLKAMGYQLPPIIEETSDHAKKFMKFARLLEQAYRKLPQYHRRSYDPIAKTNDAIQRFGALKIGAGIGGGFLGRRKARGKNNNLLTSYHIEIIDKIQDLENVSLIKDFSRWSETIKNIKNVIANVENKGFKNPQSWKREIDVKLCPILEAEYTKNLKSLHLTLEEIRVDLVYRNSPLNFSPDRLILDQMYEQQLKKYLNIPKNFKGVSDNSEQIYEKIIERNEAVLENVSKQKKELFEQLDAVIKHWQSWLQFEPLDEKKLTSWEHWDLHFRASKTFGQEIAKLPSAEERVGCFLIGLSRMRSDLESHNRSYWDQLVYSLKDSIAEDVVKLQNFIDPSTAALTKQPVSLEEIGESGFNYSSITEAHQEERVGCFLIGLSRMRSDLESHNRSYWDQLVYSLKDSIAEDVVKLQNFIDPSTAALTKQPVSLEEIGESGFNYSSITEAHQEEVQAKRSEWNSVLEELSWKAFEQFNTEFEKFSSQYWIVFRKKCYELEDFIQTWEQRFNQENTLSRFVPTILLDLQKYKDIAPALKYVKGEDFSEKHWSDNIRGNVKELQTLCKKAASEIVIRQALKEIDQWEVQTKFLLTNHADCHGKPIALIKEFKDILNTVIIKEILLQSLKHSSNLNAFAERATSWENKLEELNGFLNSLAQIQKKWLYLESIFGGGTLAQEKLRFDRLDRDFRKILAFIERDTRVTEICNFPNLNSTLLSILEQLSRCQHSLDAFLKEKREIFSRFLFLSDDDLLEIIGQSSKEQVIQSHLKKLFAGVYSVQLDATSANIVAMCSLQGEVVKLENAVTIQRPVEEWLGELVKEMQRTLKELLVICQKENQADPLKFPSQILCLSDNISFTQKCEQAISSMTLPALLAKYKAQLSDLSSLELNTSAEMSTKDDSNVLELKLKALLLDTIHHI
ncbi:hypothetical protein HUJ04_010735 [Dendroctonus ponderosae]|nr:hypothetical protein HUJ04_010735 [Dendroctonus ponderosae]